MMRSLHWSVLAWLATVLIATAATAQEPSDPLRRLLQAYPTVLDRIDGNDLVWRDGTRMPIDDGRGAKPHETVLAAADIKDMMSLPYVTGKSSANPAINADPGRARNAAFFTKMYGDCTTESIAAKLVNVVWLPRKYGKTLKFTAVNGAAENLAAVSKELDALPAAFDRFLMPPAGTFVCRSIAGTHRVSAHGYGIAIDISTAHTDYWQWAGGKAGGAIAYRNRVPMEIVEIFEKHGFVWGGKWYHYDTMHFEYRPELVPPQLRESRP